MNFFKRVLLSFLSFTLIFSLVGPTIGQAQSIPPDSSVTIDEELIQKADPYIYLNPKSKQFEIQANITSVLNKHELIRVQEVIKKSNADVKLYRDDLVINTDENIFNSNIQEENTDDFETMAINKKKNFDWDFTWWGLRVYWSDKFVKKLKSNLVIFGGGVAALNATIAYFLSPPGWVTSFVAAVAGIGVGVFISRNKGCGVYLDCYLYIPTRWYSAC